MNNGICGSGSEIHQDRPAPSCRPFSFSGWTSNLPRRPPCYLLSRPRVSISLTTEKNWFCHSPQPVNWQSEVSEQLKIATRSSMINERKLWTCELDTGFLCIFLKMRWGSNIKPHDLGEDPSESHAVMTQMSL